MVTYKKGGRLKSLLSSEQFCLPGRGFIFEKEERVDLHRKRKGWIDSLQKRKEHAPF